MFVVTVAVVQFLIPLLPLHRWALCFLKQLSRALRLSFCSVTEKRLYEFNTKLKTVDIYGMIRQIW